MFVVNRQTVFFSFCYIYKDFVRQLKVVSAVLLSLLSLWNVPGVGAFDHLNGPLSVGHLKGILAQVGGNSSNNFHKSQMPGGLPGGTMLKLRFDRYIIVCLKDNYVNVTNHLHCRVNKLSFWISLKVFVCKLTTGPVVNLHRSQKSRILCKLCDYFEKKSR